MAKFLIQATYSIDGTKGLLKEGGTKRRAAIEKAVKSAGAKLESIYYALGDTDLFAVIDAPDNGTAAALAMSVGSAGGIHIKTTALLTVSEMDAAVKKQIAYRAPGA